MSESVACALDLINNNDTLETRTFIRMFDRFFDIMNIRTPSDGTREIKEIKRPFTKPDDNRFKVHCTHISKVQSCYFLSCLCSG